MARSYPTWIAGLRYQGPDGTNRGTYCRRLAVGTTMELVREPDNPHSESGLAVAIQHAGRHLGYIPSRHHWIGSALDEGKSIVCVIDRIETEGWIFRRARFVGLTVTVTMAAADPDDARRRKQAAEARQLCIDGLRVLAHIARSDGDLSTGELAVQAAYIAARLQGAGLHSESIEGLLTEAQALKVSPRSFTRALNLVAADKDYFAQVLRAALNLAEQDNSVHAGEAAALAKIQAVGKLKGWL